MFRGKLRPSIHKPHLALVPEGGTEARPTLRYPEGQAQGTPFSLSFPSHLPLQLSELRNKEVHPPCKRMWVPPREPQPPLSLSPSPAMRKIVVFDEPTWLGAVTHKKQMSPLACLFFSEKTFELPTKNTKELGISSGLFIQAVPEMTPPPGSLP